MSGPGRPKALDDNTRKTVSSLVADGVSLREAAHFVDCDPKSIRREAQRNEEFRRELAKARSEACIHPLQTLRQAAKSNWRAALELMNRLDPARSGRQNSSVVTKREANQFLKDLFQIIENAVSSPRERRSVYKLLTVSMPPAMRRHWQGGTRRENMRQAMQAFDKSKDKEVAERCKRRNEFIDKFGPHLPWDLLGQLRDYSDVLDPEGLRVDRKHNRARLALANANGIADSKPEDGDETNNAPPPPDIDPQTSDFASPM